MNKKFLEEAINLYDLWDDLPSIDLTPSNGLFNFWLNRKQNKIKFRGKFQEACRLNTSRSYYMRIYLYGWRECQHCDCAPCSSRRQDFNLERCTKEKRCDACIKKDES